MIICVNYCKIVKYELIFNSSYIISYEIVNHFDHFIIYNILRCLAKYNL